MTDQMSIRHGYHTPAWKIAQGAMIGQNSSTWGAYARQELGLAGTALRLMDNPDLLITGNDSVFGGIARYAYGAAGSLMAMAGMGEQQEMARFIDETVDELYSSVLTDYLGYTPARGTYEGPIPGNLEESKINEFLFRINSEATVEGRNAILRQVRQEGSDKEALSRASVGKLLTVGLLSLPFDESFWIDLYVTKGALKLDSVRRLARMHKIVSTAGIGAMGAGVSGGIREAVLYKGQFTRTPEEVLRNIKIEAAFGGLMGAGIATMGTAYRSATRARYGADTIEDAVIQAQRDLTSNLMDPRNRGLRQSMTNLLDAFQAGRNVDEARLDSVLDRYLDGANQNVVELIGMRRGTWRNSLLNKFFFLTPNIRFASSSLASPRQFIDMLTDTGLAKSNANTGSSLERMSILLEGYQDMSRMEMSDIFRRATDDGANLGSEEAFDTAVEMIYRRDPSGNFDVPDRITFTDVQGNRTVNAMDTDEPLNQQARKAIQEAAKKFAKEQEVYDMLTVQSGQNSFDTMTNIRKLYKEMHGENFVHRLIDREAVMLDRTGARDAVMAGIRDLRNKLEPEIQQRINSADLELQRLDAALAAGAEPGQVRSMKRTVKERKKAAEEELENLTPDPDRAMNVVMEWMKPADGVIQPTRGEMRRSVLIKDEFIEPYLIKSVEAQRSAFFRNTGIRGVAFNKLASVESRQYVKRTNEINQETLELEDQLRNASTEQEVDDLYRKIAILAEEQDILVQTARLSTDMRLASRLTDTELRAKLREVRVLKEGLMNAHRAEDKVAFNELRTKLNDLSKDFVRVHKISDTNKSDGNISEHQALRSFRSREGRAVDTDDMVLDALDADPRIYKMAERLEAIRASGSAERQRIVRLETAGNEASRNFRMEATMEREVAANGYQKKQIKEFERHVNDLKVINERIFGVRGSDSDGALGTLGPLMRNYNYMTSMGGVTLSSFPDIAMGVFTAGLGPYLATTYKYAKHVTKNMLSDSAPDHKFFQFDMIHALESNTQGARVRQLMAVDRTEVQAFGRRRKEARQQMLDLSARGASAMTKYSLLGTWNGFWKAVNNGAAASRIGRIADKLGKGRRLSGSDQRFLDRLKLDKADVQDMDKLYKKFGESEGTGLGSRFYYAKSQLWSGGVRGMSSQRVFELKSKLNASLSMNADMSIITPGAGSLPAIVDKSEATNLLFQFKRYFFTATENLLIPMMQRTGTGDMAALMTGGGLLVAGAIVTAAKAQVKGQDPFPHLTLTGGKPEGSTKEDYYNNIVALTVNAVDRSGILGIMTEPMNLMSKLGYDPISVLTNSEEKLGRAQSRPVAEMLVGPSLGKLQTMFDVATSTIGIARGEEPLTAAATKDFMAMIPYQNLLPFTLIANTGFTALEASDRADSYNRMYPDAPAKGAADFYYDQFRFIEHRLAPLFAPVDYSGYDPKTAIVQ